MTLDERHKAVDDICERFLMELSEHVDAVQVLASFDHEGVTMMAMKGSGNFYARVGMAQALLDRDKAREGLDVEYNEYRED